MPPLKACLVYHPSVLSPQRATLPLEEGKTSAPLQALTSLALHPSAVVSRPNAPLLPVLAEWARRGPSNMGNSQNSQREKLGAHYNMRERGEAESCRWWWHPEATMLGRATRTRHLGSRNPQDPEQKQLGRCTVVVRESARQFAAL